MGEPIGVHGAATEHHAQLDVTRMNVLQTARAGLTSMQHWYGLPEALFTDRRVQDYPVNYNYQNEADRFREAGRLWKQAAPPGSERWNEVMNELLELDFTIVPTWVAYLASRDLMRQSRNEWHAVHTLPSLWNFYRPSPLAPRNVRQYAMDFFGHFIPGLDGFDGGNVPRRGR